MSDIYFGDPLTYLKGTLLQQQTAGAAQENQLRGIAIQQAAGAMARQSDYRSYLARLTGMGGPNPPTPNPSVQTSPGPAGTEVDDGMGGTNIVPPTGSPGAAGPLMNAATGGAAPNGSAQPSATTPSLMDSATGGAPKQSDMALREYQRAQSFLAGAQAIGIPEEVDRQQKLAESAYTKYTASLKTEQEMSAARAADLHKVFSDGVGNPIALNAGLKNHEVQFGVADTRRAVAQVGIHYDPATNSYTGDDNTLKALAPAAYTAQQQFEDKARLIELAQTKAKNEADIVKQKADVIAKNQEIAINRARLQQVDIPKTQAEIAAAGLTRANTVRDQIQGNFGSNDIIKNIDKFRVVDQQASSMDTVLNTPQKDTMGRTKAVVLDPTQSQQLIMSFHNASNLFRGQMGGGASADVDSEDVKALSGRLQKIGTSISTVGAGMSLPNDAAKEVTKAIHDVTNNVLASAYVTEAKGVQAAANADPTGRAVSSLQLSAFNPQTLSRLVANGKAQVNEFWPGTKVPKTVTVQGQRLEFARPGSP